jgi:hypothetical protein
MSIYSSSSISIHCRQVDALHSFLLYYNWSLDWVTVTFFYTVGVVYRRSPSSVHVPRYQIVVLVLVQLLILGISPSLDLEQGLNLELSWVLWINTQLRSNIPNIPNKKKKNKTCLPQQTQKSKSILPFNDLDRRLGEGGGTETQNTGIDGRACAGMGGWGLATVLVFGRDTNLQSLGVTP